MIGVLGTDWRGWVTERGQLGEVAGTAPMDWAIAADDRWHRPTEEVAVRQQRIGGAPVFETRLRIPGGDAVQRIWAVADGGGRTMIEVANDSPLPIACAFTRPDLLTTRPPTDVPIEGIDLPAGTIVLPIGHRTSVTVALAHDGTGPGLLAAGWPSPDTVARGWKTMAERAGRLVLPDGPLVDAVVAARCALLLSARWGHAAPDEPERMLLEAAELARLDEPWVGGDLPLDVATAVEGLLRQPELDPWTTEAALDAAAFVLHRLGEHRAVGDLQRILAARGGPAAPLDPGADVARLEPHEVGAWVERMLFAGGELFPRGIPVQWRGAPIEAYGLTAGPASALSFGIRWHGENAAVLWEVGGEPCSMRASAVDPAWSTSEPTGEALWRVDGTDAQSPLASTDSSTSFS